jgi:hypothetical protein
MHTRQWAIVFFLFAFLLLPGIDHGIWRPDEQLVACICSEMARSGDYIVPHLKGIPFLEKPSPSTGKESISGLTNRTKSLAYKGSLRI